MVLKDHLEWTIIRGVILLHKLDQQYLHTDADGNDADEADDGEKMEVVIMGLSYLPHTEVEHCADVDDQEESAHNGESKHW